MYEATTQENKLWLEATSQRNTKRHAISMHVQGFYVTHSGMHMYTYQQASHPQITRMAYFVQQQNFNRLNLRQSVHNY